MSDVKKFDAFKPEQPMIPGVPSADESREDAAAPEPWPPRYPGAAQPPAGQSALLWIALAAAGALIAGGGLFYWGRSSSAKSQPRAPVEAAAAPVVESKPEQTENLPVGPGPIATTTELSKAWSAKRFLFRDPVGSKLIPAMVVRLPGGQYWGFSLREPFGDCELEYVTDLKKLQTDYRFEANHPMVANPCSRTVYDLMRYGNGATNGGVVRGDIVQGSGVRPPIAIEIRTSGKDVIAVRSE